jgi:septal ring-binding cell division protein DamX
MHSSHPSPPPSPAESEAVLNELQASLWELSHRVAVLGQLKATETTDADTAEVGRDPWEHVVRRFTGSLDVRLDILETELGEVQDELNEVRERIEAGVRDVERRLTRRSVAGQGVLGLLIILLSFFGPPFGGSVTPPRDPASSPADADLGAPPPGAKDPGAASKPLQPGALNTPLPDDGDGAAPGVPDAAEPDRVPTSDPGTAHRSAAVSAGSVVEAGEQVSAEAAVEVFPVAEQPPGSLEGAPARAGAGLPAGQDRAAAHGQAAQGDERGASGEPAPPPDDPVSKGDTTPGGSMLQEERFAVQLISFRSESSVAPFVERFGIADSARYLKYDSDRQEWHAVVLGNYLSRSEAQAALEALPPRLRDLKPWIRPLPAGTSLISIAALNDADQDG